MDIKNLILKSLIFETQMDEMIAAAISIHDNDEEVAGGETWY